MESRTQYFSAAFADGKDARGRARAATDAGTAEVPPGLNGGRSRWSPAPVRTPGVPDFGPAVPPDDPPGRAVAAPRAREAR
ncbi:hypothetical protein SAMN05192584_101523 [Streptomyces pini]|uniref:Uncharacterized protein n=1 Tax=Streptomyces pini TaxID=1520580 RepID=A0A1I3UMH8_9ACTN|nr:hypothetical protein SAMN05192584_101523 [Streptomyces pini]